MLQEDKKLLDEVVVVGYGTIRKADLAGSVSVMDNKSLKISLSLEFQTL